MDLLLYLIVGSLGFALGWMTKDTNGHKVKLTYTSDVGLAGQKYVDSLVRHTHLSVYLPATFRWADLFKVMVEEAGGVVDEK